jgi:hypothetical protein
MGLNPLPESKLGIASHKIRFLFVLSANNEKSVKAQMKSLQMYLEQRPETLELSVMGKLAYTLCQRRSFLTWKVAVSATTSSELIQKLSNPDLKPESAFAAPKISYVFTGQGAQWFAMGRELMRIYPAYASSIELADQHLRSFGADWSLIGKFNHGSIGILLTGLTIEQRSCPRTQRHLVWTRPSSASQLVQLCKLPLCVCFHRGMSILPLSLATLVVKSAQRLRQASCLSRPACKSPTTAASRR